LGHSIPFQLVYRERFLEGEEEFTRQLRRFDVSISFECGNDLPLSGHLALTERRMALRLDPNLFRHASLAPPWTHDAHRGEQRRAAKFSMKFGDCCKRPADPGR
jgi:hypothetical protein